MWACVILIPLSLRNFYFVSLRVLTILLDSSKGMTFDSDDHNAADSNGGDSRTHINLPFASPLLIKI